VVLLSRGFQASTLSEIAERASTAIKSTDGKNDAGRLKNMTQKKTSPRL
jgi:hypothetical protein